jgi:hypothetical protein
MREIKMGGKVVRVRATPLALLFYKQEFKADLLGDMIKMQGIEADLSQLDLVSCLQLIWAMAKADAYGKQFPSFEAWLAGFEGFDISDPSFLLGALEEASDGFLGGGKKQV